MQPFYCIFSEFSPVVHCEYVPVIDNGNRTLHGTKVGDNATYECHAGFTQINGDSVRVCQSDGQWSGYPPDCVKRGKINIAPLVISDDAKSQTSILDFVLKN